MTTCHSTLDAIRDGQNLVALIGNPNVGKSMIFHKLTGQYVTVSNYPGTTVELARGSVKMIPDTALIDTPGILSFPSRTEDELVTARVILNEPLRSILQVGDSKNLRRTLHLTVQLAEMGVPMQLALNMTDEAQALGMAINEAALSQYLGLPVIQTVAIHGKGLPRIAANLVTAPPPTIHVQYPAPIEDAIQALEILLPQGQISQRALALLWLNGDPSLHEWLEAAPDGILSKAEAIRESCQQMVGSINTHIQRAREVFIEEIIKSSLVRTNSKQSGWVGVLSSITTHPFWGLPFLFLVLLGMYEFVGVFGAGTLVGLLENGLFGTVINPWITEQIFRIIPSRLLAELLVGEYGLWTMGVTYAVALLLPIVVTFFITFGILEDSGYLPRLSVLTNRLFNLMGLNGQAVLPMVLGLGCVTMATMTTRIMSSRRDRILVTFLLALAVPCSAQLGVVMGMLAGISLSAALIWSGVMLGVLLLVGWLASRIMPGERTPLLVELPPLRFPVLSNVLIKTAARLEWYIKEAVPLFLIGTLLLFILEQTHILPILIRWTEPVVVGWLGLPAEAASAFLLGLMRRDFAATGLFHMEAHGLLTPIQVVVSIVTITLFIPCIASLFMIVKERGWKTAVGMSLFIFPFALLIGGLLERLLNLLGWNG